MRERLTIRNPEGNALYDIVIDRQFNGLPDELSALGFSGRKACIVADTNTAVRYADEVKRLLDPICDTTALFCFRAGEENKTLDTVRDLYAFLISQQFDRKDFLVALGGGVVGDLCGFAAATYLRGIAFIQVPTTLLAQSDSSVGGKTGVDFDGFKNMVGAFSMPKLVYMNVETLCTLDERTYLSGMGEVIKHGLIYDSSFLSLIRAHREDILERNPEFLIRMAYGNCSIKGKVVEEDPTEQGIRKILNFGHTLGHAIEKQRAGELYHGECVSAGMAAAAYISFLRGYLTQEELDEICSLLQSFRLPVKLSFDPEQALRATRNDKKKSGKSLAFILLKAPGTACIDLTVSEREMMEGLLYIHKD